MKKILFSFLIAFALAPRAFAQPVNIQYYWDANNNCTFDSQEALLYNLPFSPQLTYRTANNTLATAMSSMMCGSSPMAVSNPSTPATNTLIPNVFSNFTSFAAGSCTTTAWKNLAYSGTNMIPVANPGPMSSVSYATKFHNGTVTSQLIPYCTNQNDSLSLSYSLMNAFTCSTGVTPRTYTFYLDGVLLDHVTTTGLPSVNNFVVGVNNKIRISEFYSSWQSYHSWNIKLPTTMSAGTHTITMQTSMIYNSPLSAITLTCFVYASPCTSFSGLFYNDCNNNCIYDSGDGPLGVGMNASVYNSTLSMNFTPNSSGQFSVYLPTGTSYSFAHNAIAALNATSCSSSTINLGSNPTSYTLGYKIAPYYDPNVFVQRSPGGTTNPGNTMRFITGSTGSNFYTCSSNPTSSGKLKVVLKPFLTYIGTSTSPSPTLVTASTGDTLVWTVSNYFNFGTKDFSVTISGTISLQTPYTVEAYISPTIDQNLLNNSCFFSGTIGAPYDPNSKEFYSKKMFPNGNFLTGNPVYYTINFQNLGTAPAVNIKVRDTIDANLDLSSLQILQSSFRVHMQRNNTTREVVFMFDGINLPAKITDEPGSQGFVRYQINLNAGVPFNTVIKNRAHNYFDYTDPVATNQTINKLVTTVGIDEAQNVLHKIKLMPNPFTETLKVSAGSEISQINVYNNLGQLVFVQPVLAQTAELDFTELSQGIYFVTLKLSNGEEVTNKVIKN